MTLFDLIATLLNQLGNPSPAIRDRIWVLLTRSLAGVALLGATGATLAVVAGGGWGPLGR